MFRRTAITLSVLISLVSAQAVTGDDRAWIARSNENTRVLLEVQSRFSPEGAGRIGMDGYDEEIFQLPMDRTARVLKANRAAMRTLEETLADEKDPLVRQDLQILIDSVARNIKGIELGETSDLPYFNLPQCIFQGLQTLLDDQVPAERRAAAVVRIRKYAGLEEGYVPIAEQATAYISAKLPDTSVRGPFRENLQRDLDKTARFVGGIEQLFNAYELDGWQEAHEALAAQLEAYSTFLRKELMPRTTTDFRIPEEQYRHALETYGVDLPLEDLVSRAKVSFREIQN